MVKARQTVGRARAKKLGRAKKSHENISKEEPGNQTRQFVQSVKSQCKKLGRARKILMLRQLALQALPKWGIHWMQEQ